MSVPIRVIAVDDEKAIIDILQVALEEGGYTVTIALSGADAIEILDREHSEYRAVITDINMGPGSPTGWDVGKRARELNPDLPVVYMTGGNGHEWSANGVPNSVLVTKPFAPAQVVTAVSNLLNSSDLGAS